MTDSLDGDRALVDTARAALHRSEVAHREMAETPLPGSPPEWATDHAILADQAAHQAKCLANLDLGQSIDPSGLNALWAGEEALRREAGGWRALGAVATEEFWRTEFHASADEADREAASIEDLRHRLFHRDHGAELGIER